MTKPLSSYPEEERYRIARARLLANEKNEQPGLGALAARDYMAKRPAKKLTTKDIKGEV